jgi:hypothetical protein
VSVLAHAVAPESVRVTVRNADLAGTPLDLTTVTAVSFQVLTPKPQTWSVVVVSQTATELVADHEFSTGDVEHAGDYKILVLLTVPGGTRRAGPTMLKVLDT